MLSFGNKLRHYREAKGLMRKQLAHQAGCAVVTIQKIERDERKPSFELAQRLGQALQLSPPEHALLLAALQPAPQPPLPAPAAPVAPTFIGRATERQTIVQRLTSGTTRLLTLTGTGGVGKTRLAETVAADLRPAFADGVQIVELATIRQPTLLPSALVRALDGTPSDERTAITTLLELLRPRQLLLLLDNFEQLSTAAPLLTELLEQCPRLTLLVTARAALHLPAEEQLRIEPLALPPRPTAEPVDLAAISSSPAITLFVSRAQAAQPSFTLDQNNVQAVIQLCTLLDGLPLAIELMAARIRLMSPQLLLARLITAAGRPRLDLIAQPLASLPGSQPTRQETLRASLAWSYQLLNPIEQQAFCHFGLFHGGCRLLDAELLLYPDQAEPEQTTLYTWDLLSSLLDKSLIYQRMVEGEPRFLMLETVREYAREQLLAMPGAHAIQQRYAEHYREVAQRFAERIVEGAQLAQWLAAAEREHANWRAALTWSLDQGEAALALQIATALWRFWWIRSYWQEGCAWLERGLAAFTATNRTAQQLRARALRAAGALRLEQGEHSTARRHLMHSQILARAVGDEYTEALALSSLATLLCREGDFIQAEAAMLQSTAYDRKTGNVRDLAVSLGILGEIGLYQRDFPKAVDYLQQALALQTQRNDHHSCMITQLNLGYACAEQGDYVAAKPHVEAGLQLARLLTNPLAEATGLQQLAELYFATAQPAEARHTLTAAFAVAQKHKLQRNLASLLGVLGEAQLRQGNEAFAIQLFGAVHGAVAAWQIKLDHHEQSRLAARLAQVRAQHNPTAFEFHYRTGFAAPEATITTARDLLRIL